MESLERKKNEAAPSDQQPENLYGHINGPENNETGVAQDRLAELRGELKASALELNVVDESPERPPSQRPIIVNPKIAGIGAMVRKFAAYAGLIGVTAGGVQKAEAVEPPPVSNANAITVPSSAEKNTNVFVYKQKQWPKTKAAPSAKPAEQAPTRVEINLSNVTAAGKFAVERMEKARSEIGQVQNKDDANAYLKDHYEGFVSDFFGPNGGKDLHHRFLNATDDDLNTIAASAVELRNTVGSLEAKFGIKGGKGMKDRLSTVERISKRFTTYAGKKERELLKKQEAGAPAPSTGEAAGGNAVPGYNGGGGAPSYGGGSGDYGRGGYRFEQGSHSGGGSIGNASPSSDGSGGGSAPRY